MKKTLTSVALALCTAAICIFTLTSCDKVPVTQEPVKYTVTVTNDGNGTGTASPAASAEGTTVTITATPNEDYVFNKWVVVGGGIKLSDEAANPATFVMPAKNVEVRALFNADKFNGFDRIPDERFRDYCKIFDTDEDQILSREEIAAVTEIMMIMNGVESLEGLQMFTNLVDFTCISNDVSTVDLSKNPYYPTKIPQRTKYQ